MPYYNQHPSNPAIYTSIQSLFTRWRARKAFQVESIVGVLKCFCSLLLAVSWDLLDREGHVATWLLISTLHALSSSSNSMHSGVTFRGQANPCCLTLNHSVCWCATLIITCHELNCAKWQLLNCCCLVRLHRIGLFHLFVCLVFLYPLGFIPNLNCHVFLPS